MSASAKAIDTCTHQARFTFTHMSSNRARLRGSASAASVEACAVRSSSEPANRAGGTKGGTTAGACVVATLCHRKAPRARASRRAGAECCTWYQRVHKLTRLLLVAVRAWVLLGVFAAAPLSTDWNGRSRSQSNAVCTASQDRASLSYTEQVDRFRVHGDDECALTS